MAYSDDADTIGLYHLEDAGAAVVDSSSQGNNGTQTGMVTQVSAGAAFGFGMESNASTDRIEFDAISGDFDPLEGTVEMFFAASEVADWNDSADHWLVQLRADGNNVFEIAKGVSNNLIFRYRAAGTASQVTAATLDDVVRHHYKLTWNKAADEVRAFIDGVQTGATQSGLGVWVGAIAAATAVNRNTNDRGFEGVIDEIRVSDVARLSGPDLPATATPDLMPPRYPVLDELDTNLLELFLI